MINQKEITILIQKIRIKTSILRSYLYHYSNAYIIVKGNITVIKKIFTAIDFEAPNNTANNTIFDEKKLVFKNNVPFIICISKINGIKIDIAEDLDFVMPMYNLHEYSKNYRKTTGNLWNYYRDEPNSDTDDNEILDSIIDLKSFDYKANFMENGVTQNNLIKIMSKLLFH